MVVFTCSHCGESVQKPKVEKHYETKCRNNLPNLCCMDCLKDFRGDEFKVHTKCVSEAERYGGKGFVAKPNQNKGEKKQNAWIEIVQSVLDENMKLSGALKCLLERVAQQPNTPRKKIKFINFIRSMDHRVSMADIEAAWDLLSAKLDLLKTCTETKIPNGKSAVNKDKEENTEEKVESEVMQVDSELTVVSLGKKHKKNKKDKKGSEEEKQNGELSEEMTVEVVNGEDDKLVEKSLSKKDKKEKKKRDKYEAQLKEAALPPNDEEIEENSVEIKKKAKKRKLAQVTEDIANCTIVESSSVSKEKNANECEPKIKKNKAEFDWSNTILTVLESKGKDMALKKLQKTVLNEYCVVSGVSEIPERIAKKFTKTLYKIPNVKIINDKASLVKEDE